MFSSNSKNSQTVQVTYKNSNGVILQEVVTVPFGQAWQAKQIIEGRGGNVLGMSVVG